MVETVEAADVGDKMGTKNTNLGVVVIIALVFLASLWAIFNPYGSGMMGTYGYNMMYGFGFFGAIYIVVILIALVLFIFWLVQQLQRGNRK